MGAVRAGPAFLSVVGSLRRAALASSAPRLSCRRVFRHLSARPLHSCERRRWKIWRRSLCDAGSACRRLRCWNEDQRRARRLVHFYWHDALAALTCAMAQIGRNRPFYSGRQGFETLGFHLSPGSASAGRGFFSGPPRGLLHYGGKDADRAEQDHGGAKGDQEHGLLERAKVFGHGGGFLFRETVLRSRRTSAKAKPLRD